jgi:hypothetical protein
VFTGSLRFPGLCGSPSRICFMNNIHDLDSVGRRQTVTSGNVMSSGVFDTYSDICFMNSLHYLVFSLLKANSVHS